MAKRAKRKLYGMKAKVRGDKVHAARVLRISRKANSVVISKQKYEGLKETIHLLRNPANAQDLRDAIAEADAGKFIEAPLID